MSGINMQLINALVGKTEFRYKFSIVMAVYNVEPFLQEAIDSVLQQTIGFKGNVQLILVDDGSKDQSGVICDAYKKAYPDNIVVIHKENGGVSSARNEGLKYIQGRYINFMDSDDKLSENTLEEVFKFFIEHDSETDAVAIPMYFFDGKTGEHGLNYKFKKGQRVVDLRKEYTYSQLSMSSAFFKENTVRDIQFDKELKQAEDAKEILKILSDRMTIGIVPSGRYLYRKRTEGELSATQSVVQRKECYTVYLENFVKFSIDYYKKKWGYIPKFVQYTLMYDLEWKVNQESIPDNILTKKEKEEYYDLLFKLISMFDDEIILMQKYMHIEYKTFLLKKKYNRPPSVVHHNLELSLYFENTHVTDYSGHFLKIDFINLIKDKFILEGSTSYIPFSKEHNIEILLKINDSFVRATEEKMIESKFINNECILYTDYFVLEIPIRELQDKEENIIELFIKIDGYLVKKQGIIWGMYSPISSVYEKQYCYLGDWRIKGRYSSIEIEKKRGFKDEFSFCHELIKTRRISDIKAVFARSAYHLIKHFKRKEIWLLSDRINKADDNGEALFIYLQGQEDINTYFAIGKESLNKKYLKRIGKVVEYNSFRYKMIHLLSDKIVSSQADPFTTNPFIGYSEPYRDILAEQKFVFLQHGITKDNVSSWLNRRNKNIKLFITAAKPEYQSILDYDYNYDDSVVKLTGFPRHDRLYHDEKKIITIIPTWRAALVTGLDANTGLRKVKSHFETSTYNKMYTNLMTDKRLILAAEEYGYQIQFLPHPNMVDGMKYMKISSEIKILDLEMPYRKVFAESDLLITDYSSVAFDFTYLRKPVIYFQQDKEEFFANHTYTEGYFDYERDGFGEVCYDVETLVDTIIEYMKNGCQLKDKYRKRIDNFFAYHDQNNCRRVYEEIVKL